MKRTALLIYSIVVVLLAGHIGIFIHELGHIVIAFFCKLPINDFSIINLSYVQINALTASNFELSMISIGSFIIPELIYLALLFSSNSYIVIFRIFSGMSLYMHIFMSIVILITGSNQPETWDILMFQKYSNTNSIVIFIFFVLIVSLNVFLEIKNSGIKKLLNSI